MIHAIASETTLCVQWKNAGVKQPGKGDTLMAKVELKQPIVDEIKSKIDGAATVTKTH